MDVTAFFGVVSTIDFALLGLWWVAVQTRPDLRTREFRTGRMAYLVSLQFLVPGTASLLAQIDPPFGAVWRVAFTLAGLSGLAAILALVPELAAAGEPGVARLLRWGALPVHVLISIIALFPQIVDSLTTRMDALEVEAVLFCVMVFLGAQTAWAAAMQPEQTQPENQPEALPREVVRP